MEGSGKLLDLAVKEPPKVKLTLLEMLNCEEPGVAIMDSGRIGLKLFEVSWAGIASTMRSIALPANASFDVDFPAIEGEHSKP